MSASGGNVIPQVDGIINSYILNLKQKYIFDIILNTTQKSFTNKLHLLILPYEYDISDCVVITWERLYDILSSVIPKDDYFLMRLESAIARIKI